MRIKFSTAVKRVTEELKKDPDLFNSYQANIAMAFKDEFNKFGKRKKYRNKEAIHSIANTAASNFLNLLINQTK